MSDLGGRAFVYGDDIDTDALAPGRYMSAPLAELAAHCLEVIDPDFAGAVAPGDVVVAGQNFGMGSSREQAAHALKHLGIAGVVAESFGGIFYRNAVNVGLPVMVGPARAAVSSGDSVRLDIDGATLVQAGGTVSLEPLPENLRQLVEDGGLVLHLKKRFANVPGSKR